LLFVARPRLISAPTMLAQTVVQRQLVGRRVARPACRRRLICQAKSRTDTLRELLRQPGIIKVPASPARPSAARSAVERGACMRRRSRGDRADLCMRSPATSARRALARWGRRPACCVPPPPTVAVPLQGPCCHDALSARLIEKAGFDFAFMSGFCTAAARLGAPDTGLITYAEMVDQVPAAAGVGRSAGCMLAVGPGGLPALRWAQQ